MVEGFRKDTRPCCTSEVLGSRIRAELNLNAIPAVKDLGQITHGMAKNDPLTGQAIKMIHNGVNIHVLNDGGTFTMTFKNKFGDVPLLMTVELEHR